MFNDLNEKIEKHDELNPKLFDKNTNLLYDDIREKLLEITDAFLEDLEQDNITIIIKDIILIGSNASYNYTKDSDIDMHIIADTSSLHCPDNLYPALYSAYRSLFNKKYAISIHEIPVELYVETENLETNSAGIYSIKDNSWLKVPEKIDIPDIDQTAVDKAVKPWKNRCTELIAKIKENKLTPAEAYDQLMLLIEDLYNLRKAALKTEGEYSTGNLIFKEIRNIGLLDELKSIKNQEMAKKLSLEALKEQLTNMQLRDYRIKIMQTVHESPIIQQNGYFYLHNIRSNQVDLIIRKLKTLPFIETVTRGAAGKYDFSHINPISGPQQLYTINGKIKL